LSRGSTAEIETTSVEVADAAGVDADTEIRDVTASEDRPSHTDDDSEAVIAK